MKVTVIHLAEALLQTSSRLKDDSEELYLLLLNYACGGYLIVFDEEVLPPKFNPECFLKQAGPIKAGA